MNKKFKCLLFSETKIVREDSQFLLIEEIEVVMDEIAVGAEYLLC